MVAIGSKGRSATPAGRGVAAFAGFTVFLGQSSLTRRSRRATPAFMTHSARHDRRHDWMSPRVIRGKALFLPVALAAMLVCGAAVEVPTTTPPPSTPAPLSSGSVSQSAAQTLSGGTAELVERLQSDEPEVVIRALMALGLKKDIAAFVPILKLLVTRSDPDIRAVALATLEKLEYSVSFLVSVLEDGRQPAVAQAYAAYMLGRMQAREALPALVSALQSPYATVREHAMAALGSLHDMRAWKPLVIAAHEDPSPALRVKAQETAEALASATTQSSWPDAATLNAQIQDQDPAQRRAAAHALSERGNWWSVPLLIDALKDPDDEVRRLAARALGDLQDRRAVPPLIECLPTVSGLTLHTAIVALAVLKDRTAAPALIPYLEHPDPEARRFAARALGAFGDVAAAPALRRALADPVPQNRLEVTRALGSLKDGGAVPLLEKMARKDVEANRYAAIRALGAIGDPAAVAALERLLRSKDTIGVVTAINALREAGSMAAVPALEEMARKHREQWVREEALQAAIEIRGRARLEAARRPDNDVAAPSPGASPDKLSSGQTPD